MEKRQKKNVGKNVQKKTILKRRNIKIKDSVDYIFK